MAKQKTLKNRTTCPVLVFRRPGISPEPKFAPEQVEVYELVERVLQLSTEQIRLFLDITKMAIARQDLRGQQQD